MLEHIQEKDATFVTNAVAHAQKLAAKGFHVILLGGTLKQSTEAIIGTSASLMLNDYHFSIGFFGANGVCKEAGYTTPDTEEALIKKSAALQCHKFYALCDHSKFNVVSSVTLLLLLPGESCLPTVARKIIRVQRIYGSVNSLHPTKGLQREPLTLTSAPKRYSSSCV